MPYNSIIHRMNPLAKIIALIVLLVGIFLIRDIKIYIASMLLIFLLVKIGKLSVLTLLKQMKILYFMFIFLFILNIFLLRTGDVVFTVLGLDIYSGAIYQTVLILFRLTAMVFLSSVLTMTTKPLDLTLGIEQMLSPAKKIGFPAHEVAMMISIALRFIPTLVEETNKIMIAQTSRGVDFKSNKLSVKVKAVIALLIPLFVSSFKRAEELANAIEARGYNPSAVRTRFITYTWNYLDNGAMIVSFGYLGIIIWLTIIN